MRTRGERGFSLIEMLAAVAVIGVVSALAVGSTMSMVRGLRLKRDAQSLSHLVGLAKMRAASRFTRARVFADRAGNTYTLQIWDKTASAWTNEEDPTPLSTGVTFGFGTLDTAPPSQDALQFSPECTVALTGSTAEDTACIVFNSRGVPVDANGDPTGGNALYLTDGVGVYATTVTATPLVRSWWSPAQTAAWEQQ